MKNLLYVSFNRLLTADKCEVAVLSFKPEYSPNILLFQLGRKKNSLHSERVETCLLFLCLMQQLMYELL